MKIAISTNLFAAFMVAAYVFSSPAQAQVSVSSTQAVVDAPLLDVGPANFSRIPRHLTLCHSTCSMQDGNGHYHPNWLVNVPFPSHPETAAFALAYNPQNNPNPTLRTQHACREAARAACGFVEQRYPEMACDAIRLTPGPTDVYGTNALLQPMTVLCR